jgi:hypothetical protein
MIRSTTCLMLLLACGKGEPEPGSPEAWCDQVEDVAAGCGTATGIEDCVASLDACTDEDLERLFAYLDCLEVGCDQYGCLGEIGELSAGCRGG